MGAMSPASVPAALVQQTAEPLAGLALTQLMRPGAPVILGSFLSHTDMQSGSPGFGGPESAIGLFCLGTAGPAVRPAVAVGRRRPHLQPAARRAGRFEGLNTMLPAFLAGANYLLHSAGWLESGLVARYEKYMLDIETLRILQAEFTPLEVTRPSLAFGAHAEVGHAGHFLGAVHTLERFRTCFYRPMVFSTANYQRWAKAGGLDAAARAANIWQRRSIPTSGRRSTRRSRPSWRST